MDCNFDAKEARRQMEEFSAKAVRGTTYLSYKGIIANAINNGSSSVLVFAEHGQFPGIDKLVFHILQEEGFTVELGRDCMRKEHVRIEW